MRSIAADSTSHLPNRKSLKSRSLILSETPQTNQMEDPVFESRVPSGMKVMFMKNTLGIRGPSLNLIPPILLISTRALTMVT